MSIFIGNKQVALIEDLDTEIAKNLKTVNGQSLVGQGDVQIQHVALADNLYSSDSQTDAADIIARTSGGDVSIETGEATLVKMSGNSTIPVHTPESLTATKTEASRGTASLDDGSWSDLYNYRLDTNMPFYESGIYNIIWNADESKWYVNDFVLSENIDIVTTGTLLNGTTIRLDWNIQDGWQETRDASSYTVYYPEALTMSFDKSIWRSYVNANGTYNFTYDGADWKLGGGLSALTINQAIQNGDKIYFDTSKGSELANFISGLTYGSSPVYQLLDTNGHEFAIWTLKNDSDYILMLVIAENDIVPIYATGTGSVDIGMGEPVSYVEGWQNLTSGYYTLSGMEIEDSEYIEYIDDTTSATWNGVFFGNGTTPVAVDLADYGITLTGTATSGDTITVDYVAQDFGTIENATPTSFTSVGFNLYDYETRTTDNCGIARVVGTADGTWYNIKNLNVSSIVYFSTSLNGPWETLTLTSHTVGAYSTNSAVELFEDGYIKIYNDTQYTMVNLIWSGYMIGANFQEYTSDTILVPTVDINGDALPTSLYSVGDNRDEVNFDLRQWICRIDRVAYTEETLQTLLTNNPNWIEGVDYEWDNSYIYYVKTTPTSYVLESTVSGIYEVDDFGIEEVTGTTIPVEVSILYGQNLKDKLRRDVLTIGPQTLTPEQKQQVWQNLGIEPVGDNTF